MNDDNDRTAKDYEDQDAKSGPKEDDFNGHLENEKEKEDDVANDLLP